MSISDCGGAIPLALVSCCRLCGHWPTHFARARIGLSCGCRCTRRSQPLGLRPLARVVASASFGRRTILGRIQQLGKSSPSAAPHRRTGSPCCHTLQMVRRLLTSACGHAVDLRSVLSALTGEGWHVTKALVAVRRCAAKTPCFLTGYAALTHVELHWTAAVSR
jgi:hypothetical protein